jgi:divalent metal cation (Fe/Co/Zn/Cd) transporter
VSSLILMPLLGRAKLKLGSRLDSAATAGGGNAEHPCAYLAGAVLIGLLGNTRFRFWWLDPLAAFVVAGLAVREGRECWRGDG